MTQAKPLVVQVFEHTRATGIDRLVLCAAATFGSDERPDVFPGHAALARRAGVAESTSRASVQRLLGVDSSKSAKDGCRPPELEVVGKRGRSPVYRITRPWRSTPGYGAQLNAGNRRPAKISTPGYGDLDAGRRRISTPGDGAAIKNMEREHVRTAPTIPLMKEPPKPAEYFDDFWRARCLDHKVIPYPQDAASAAQDAIRAESEGVPRLVVLEAIDQAVVEKQPTRVLSIARELAKQPMIARPAGG